jgi:hypothetical protein
MMRHPLNAVHLQHAVLCAECDVVSDSPNDLCLVCGSRSLFNISRALGGKLPKDRATLVPSVLTEPRVPGGILLVPRPHRIRRKVAV